MHPHQRICWIFRIFSVIDHLRLYVQGVQEKSLFSLSTATYPTPTHSCKIFSKLSTQCECTAAPVVWPNWPISVQQLAAQCLRGRGCKTTRILGHPEHPVHIGCLESLWDKRANKHCKVFNKTLLMIDDCYTKTHGLTGLGYPRPWYQQAPIISSPFLGEIRWKRINKIDR